MALYNTESDEADAADVISADNKTTAETAEEEDVAAERIRNLQILQSIVGSKHVRIDNHHHHHSNTTTNTTTAAATAAFSSKSKRIADTPSTVFRYASVCLCVRVGMQIYPSSVYIYMYIYIYICVYCLAFRKEVPFLQNEFPGVGSSWLKCRQLDQC